MSKVISSTSLVLMAKRNWLVVSTYPSEKWVPGWHGNNSPRFKRNSLGLCNIWLVVDKTPLKTMSSSIGMMKSPLYGKIKNVPVTTNQEIVDLPFSRMLVFYFAKCQRLPGRVFWWDPLYPIDKWYKFHKSCCCNARAGAKCTVDWLIGVKFPSCMVKSQCSSMFK